MTATLPVSSLVNVSINLASAPAQAQSLSNLLILGNSDVINVVERLRTYSTLDAVATDFGASAPEYKAAAAWFGQRPQPTTVLIGRWAQTATAGRLIGATLSASQQAMNNWTAITAGAFGIAIDGAASVNISGLNFSANTSLNGVAATISAALTGATCVWNAAYQRFEFKSNTTGTASKISFLTAGTGTGATDISGMLGGLSTSSGAYVANGIAAETAVSAATLFDTNYGQQWYGLFICGVAADSDHLDVAALIEGANTKHAYGINHQAAGVLVATDTSNIAYQVKQLGYRKTITHYSSTSLYAVVSLLARILTTDYTANNTVITLMYKTEPGVVAENLNSNQLAALIGFNCNAFVNYNNNTAIIEPGVVASGDFIDTVFGADWLAIDIQNEVYNQLYSSPTKIPQTDAGNHILTTTIEAVCAQGVRNGLLAPGTWTQAGFGSLKQGDFLPKGYYVYAPPISQQNTADRAARKSVTFQVAAKLAGAIHTADVIVNINR